MIPTLTNPMGINPRNPLTFTALQNSSSVQLVAKGTPYTVELYYYTSASGQWLPYTLNTVVPLSAGQSVQFRNRVSVFSSGTGNYYRFSMTGKIAASGNIQSLLNFSDSCPEGGFFALFHSCVSLTEAPELPARTLGYYSYGSMFLGCTYLTAAPDLPATNISLANTCYGDMFYGCSRMVSAPAVLPAMNLPSGCYWNMFAGCSLLTAAPELPAETLSTNCYHSMFSGCSSLTSLNVNFRDWNGAGNSTTDWVNGVPATGIFTKPDALSEEYGTGRIPSGWTIINK